MPVSPAQLRAAREGFNRAVLTGQAYSEQVLRRTHVYEGHRFEWAAMQIDALGVFEITGLVVTRLADNVVLNMDPHWRFDVEPFVPVAAGEVEDSAEISLDATGRIYRQGMRMDATKRILMQLHAVALVSVPK